MRFLFRWWVFYPLAAIIAAAVVLASFGPALLSEHPEPVAGQFVDNALVLEGEDLGHPEPSDGTVHYVVRDTGWGVTGLRVAIEPGRGPVQPQEQGVRILLSPEAAVSLGPGPFRVEVEIAPVPVTTAPELAIAIDRGEPEWRTQPISVVHNVITYEFPSTDQAGPLISGIGIRPVATLLDYAYGVEIRRIRIIPAPQSAG